MYKAEYDANFYMYFYYHEFFWKRLIKKGLKLKMVNFFSKLKLELKKSSNEEPFIAFLIAMLNISPRIYPKKAWVGGASQVLGFPLFFKKQVFLSITWLINSLKDKNKLNIISLVNLLVDSLNKSGELWRKKKELYELCAENRLFLKLFK